MTNPRRLVLRDFRPPNRRGYVIRASDLPADAVYVGRPSKHGNPYSIGKPDPLDGRPMTRARVVGLFRDYAEDRLEREPDWLLPLAGKRLVCHCPIEDENGRPLPCHIDVLLELGA